MQLSQATVSAVVLSISLLFLPSTTHAHNITRILADHPEFSAFNYYLTITQLAAEINRRETITVCAVDNAGMSDLQSKHLSTGAIRNVLSVHVLLDYFDAKKLHQITDGTTLTATMFQTTGSAPGSTGFVNITDVKGGKVGFSPQDSNDVISASLVKLVEAIPYNISVIQISSVLPSSEGEALAPAPALSQMNITSLMSAHGCKAFAETLAESDAEKTFEDNLESGLTIFCPSDEAMKDFMPQFENLTDSGKQSLLEYHGIPIHQSLPELKSGNGLTSTLATNGNELYDFTVQNDGADVTIQTKLVTAKVVHTLIDSQPWAIYKLNKVLMPRELFKGELAPAPSPGAKSPKPSNKQKSPPAPDAPVSAPDGDVADQTADSNSASGFDDWRFVGVFFSIWLAFLQL